VPTSITKEIEALKRAAHAGPIGKRHSSFELYDLLAGCMRVAERCQRDWRARAELEQFFLSQPAVGRRYVEKGSDEFVLVCRTVFPTGSRAAERSNASRYAHCLREAAKRQIPSSELSRVLRSEGGLNALYMARPLTRTTVSTKCLNLTESVTVPKAGSFTLTLRRTADNRYEVLRDEREEPRAA
jgi:hypothetical protein